MPSCTKRYEKNEEKIQKLLYIKKNKIPKYMTRRKMTCKEARKYLLSLLYY